MKILVLAPGFLPTVGGAEVGIHEIYRRVAEWHDVIIFTPQLKGRQTEPSDSGQPYRVVRYRDWGNFGRMRLKRKTGGIIPPFSLGTWMALRSFLATESVDVINAHFAAYSGFAAVKALKTHNIPVVLSLIGRDAAPGPDVPKLWPMWSRAIAKRVTHTAFISEFCAQAHANVASLNSSVIPYGADTSELYPTAAGSELRQKHHIPKDAHVLFCLQRLAPIKRVDVAIQAFAALCQKRDDVVLIIGGKGSELQKLRQLADDLQVTDQVRFVNFIADEDLNAYFALADLFVFSSAYETFGIVLAQAMAAGVPIVAANNTAIPEVVLDGETGLLVPSVDGTTSWNAMADAIDRLLADEPLRQKMGAQARARAVAQFDWRRVAEAYERVLSDAAGINEPATAEIAV